jgi:hypothetical protein
MMANITLPVRKRSDIADLAHYATEALWRRRDAYPALVRDGKMDADEAAADLDAWAVIAADWDWCATGLDNDRCRRAPRETLPARIAALDTAIERLLGVIKTGPVTDLVIDQSECLAALRWWAEQERLAAVGKAPITATAHFLATVNHEARRREIKHPERIAA